MADLNVLIITLWMEKITLLSLGILALGTAGGIRRQSWSWN